MIASIAYFPPIEFFARAMQDSQIVLEAHEHYIKQTYRNRMRIASAQGPLDLIIPVTRPQGSKTNISDVLISYDECWHTKHWHAIVSAYKSSPYFDYYADEISDFYTVKYTDLWSFTYSILEVCIKLLSIKIKVEKTQSYIKDYTSGHNDQRYSINPKNFTHTSIYPPYTQVFEEKHGFIPNLSILDVLCNVGPESGMYIKKVSERLV